MKGTGSVVAAVVAGNKVEGVPDEFNTHHARIDLDYHERIDKKLR